MTIWNGARFTKYAVPRFRCGINYDAVVSITAWKGTVDDAHVQSFSGAFEHWCELHHPRVHVERKIRIVLLLVDHDFSLAIAVSLGYEIMRKLYRMIDSSPFPGSVFVWQNSSMTPKLTDEQGKALEKQNNRPVQIENPHTHQVAYLISADLYERFSPLFDPNDEFDPLEMMPLAHEAFAPGFLNDVLNDPLYGSRVTCRPRGANS